MDADSSLFRMWFHLPFAFPRLFFHLGPGDNDFNSEFQFILVGTSAPQECLCKDVQVAELQGCAVSSFGFIAS